MNLPSELINQFVKVTNDKTPAKKEAIVYGTAVKHEGVTYVKIDGSDLLTPVTSTADAIPGERVTVMIKNHQATITGNMSSPAARTEDVQNVLEETGDMGNKITEFEIAIGNKADVKELNAANARIDTLHTDNATIKQNLSAANAEIDTLQANEATIKQQLNANTANIETLNTTKLSAEIADAKYATIENLNATNAEVHNFEATYGDFENLATNKFAALEAEIEKLEAGEISVEALKATFATIVQLEAERARIADLEAEVGDIDTLIFGSATGSTIQTSFANAVIAQLGAAQIKSAMIESIVASKIASGDIITDNVRVKSADGKLLISDQTIQISDNNQVRVQIGKDASNDYSINIWDADGNLMFSKGGITDKAIKGAIIRNNMVSDDANIAAHKLDIDSLFDEINGSANTIKSTKVLLDEQGQTLDIAFKALTTDVSELQNSVSSQGTEIGVIQGQISTKIWQQDINTAKNEIGEVTDSLSTQYNTLKQTVDGNSSTIASHTSQISKKADSSTVTAVSDKVTSLESNLSGFKTTVSDTYATKSALSTTDTKATNAATAAANAQSGVNSLANRVSSAETSITQTANTLETKASKTEVTEAVKNITVGGRNLFENSGELTSSAIQYYSCPERTITTGEDSTVPSGKYIAFTMGESDGTFKGGPYLAASFGKQIPKMIEGETYTVSVWAKCSTAKTQGIMSAEFLNGKSSVIPALSTEWQRYIITGTYNGHTTASVAITFYYASLWKTGDVFYISSPMVEYGNKASDWKPAPEDMATNVDLTSVKDRVTSAETKITQNSTDISSIASRTSIVENRVSSAETKTNQNANSISAVASRTTANESAIAALELDAEGLTARLGTAETNISTAQTTANTAKTNAATAQSTANTAKTNAAAAQSTANTANSTANTALTNTKLQSDVTNYAQLNDDTAEYWGFTADNTADGHWYTMKVLARDKFISEWHQCKGGESFKVSFEISTSCKGNSTNGGTDSTYRGTAIGLYGYNAAGTSTGISYSTRITASADAPATVVSCIVRVSSSARKFRVFVQTESWSNFSGTIKIRNVRVDKVDEEASKTATNYLNFSSSGLVVGDHTAGTLKKNVLIDSDSVDIRDGSTVLASFGANTVELGKKAENSTIELCGGAGKITAEGDDEYDWNASLKMKSTNLNFESERNFQYTHRTSTDGKSTAYTKVSASTSLPQIYADTDGDGVSTHVDDGIDTGVGINVEAEDTVRNKRKDAGISATAKISRNNVVTDWDLVRAQMYARDWTSNKDNFLRVFPDRTTMSQPLELSGITFTGKNKILWSGSWYMTSGHTATLSEAVSKQPNGIVLVFSEYIDGAVSNTAFHCFFVPKQIVASHAGVGHCMQMTSSNLAYFATKYVYISDTKIVGNDNNTLTGASNSGITRACNRFIMRYVIGV